VLTRIELLPFPSERGTCFTENLALSRRPAVEARQAQAPSKADHQQLQGVEDQFEAFSIAQKSLIA
jgi:hypothetical protein